MNKFHVYLLPSDFNTSQFAALRVSKIFSVHIYDGLTAILLGEFARNCKVRLRRITRGEVGNLLQTKRKEFVGSFTKGRL
jgi:hypothetical protein